MIGFLQKRFSNSLYKSAHSRAFFTLYGIVWKEFKVAFSHYFTWRHPFYSFFRTIAILFSTLTRLFLGRNVKYSYAFTGEDRIIESLYKPLITENGFYVDVGCNHPVFLSNTYSLYRKGWKGICIDANPKMVKKFRKMRPKDKAVCALVSDHEKEMDFHLAQNDVLSTATPSNLEGDDMKDIKVRKVTMTTQTLTSILEEQKAPATIDILSIDAEEHDLEVIRSLDFNKYHPSLIIVEDECFEMTHPQENEVVKLLTPKGYELVGYVLKNLYFKKKA